MKKSNEFEVFSSKIKGFFIELSSNNNKVWFDDNRAFYEAEIRDNAKLFVLKMKYLFLDNGLPYIAEPKISTFRINRDIRFSKDKSPYKTNLGFIFPYCENQLIFDKQITFGLYLHYEIGQSFVVVGIHNPEPKILKILRQYIADNYEELENIINHQDFRQHFPDDFTSSEPLKRVPGYLPSHPAYEYLKKKDFTYHIKIDDNVFFDKNLPQYIFEKCKAGINYMNFLYKAIYQQ